MPLPSQRGAIFIGLNIVRTLSLVGLLLVFISNILWFAHDVAAVNDWYNHNNASSDLTQGPASDCEYFENSSVPMQAAGPAWTYVNHVLILLQVVVLTLAELGWPIKVFDAYFPVLGSRFGLAPIGVFQFCIGISILSHRVDDFTLVSAFFLLSVGILNTLLGCFREKVKVRRSITSWRDSDPDPFASSEYSRSIHRQGTQVGSNHSPRTYPISFRNVHVEEQKHDQQGDDNASINELQNSTKSLGFGRQGEKVAGLRGFMISRPLETLPRYAPKNGSGSTAF